MRKVPLIVRALRPKRPQKNKTQLNRLTKAALVNPERLFCVCGSGFKVNVRREHPI